MYKSIKYTDDHWSNIPDWVDNLDLSPEKYREGVKNVEKFIVDNKAPRYLYVLRCSGTSFFKIGISNDIDKRMRELQTGCPFKLKLVCSTEPEFEDMYAREILFLEKFFHKNYAEFHVHGEWFELSYEHIADIVFFLEDVHQLDVIGYGDKSLAVYESRVDQIVLMEEGRLKNDP
ncbi:TPA: GIY-YIG nuclease family protein [Vibrio diabolicus]